MVGPGEAVFPIEGLLDTGADTSVLPLPFAGLLGYAPRDLEPRTVQQVVGVAEAWTVTAPCSAVIAGAPDHQFGLRPFFIEGAQQALWGRTDVLRAFDVTVSERSQAFSLAPA